MTGISEDEIVLLTGEVDPERRARLWRRAKFVFATPETILNDAKIR
jgi:ERCC4-related helicase